jgi:hypothetical protein
MEGKRVYLKDGQKALPLLEPGEYIKSEAGSWYACTPNGHLGNLGDHQVTEHSDGTITVSPSILVTLVGTEEGWHGYLERGIWREV